MLIKLRFTDETQPGPDERPRRRACSLSVQTLVGALALLLALPAVAAADRQFAFSGHSVRTSDCQRDVRVHFEADFHHGHWGHVEPFKVSHLNFPNHTPPAPFGRPSGDCLPGERALILQNYRQGLPAAIPFDSDHPREFSDHDQYPRGVPLLDAYYAWVVGGVVRIRRVHRHHHLVFKARAHGDVGYAISEGGLRYYGSSTGQVQWVARGHEE
jgi:hypothetical protein